MLRLENQNANARMDTLKKILQNLENKARKKNIIIKGINDESVGNIEIKIKVLHAERLQEYKEKFRKSC